MLLFAGCFFFPGQRRPSGTPDVFGDGSPALKRWAN